MGRGNESMGIVMLIGLVIMVLIVILCVNEQSKHQSEINKIKMEKTRTYWDKINKQW